MAEQPPLDVNLRVLVHVAHDYCGTALSGCQEARCHIGTETASKECSGLAEDLFAGDRGTAFGPPDQFGLTVMPVSPELERDPEGGVDERHPPQTTSPTSAGSR